MIMTDNIRVDNNVITYKCRVEGNGTVLLLPSQVNKYLGSYEKHKMINYGILINKNTILDIVSEETINNKVWLLIVYNNKYYYTPKEYVNTNKLIKLDSDILSMQNNLKTMKISKANSGSINNTNEVYSSNKWERTILFDSNNYLIGTAKSDIILYEYPSTSSKVITTINSGESFLVQSKWRNNKTKNSFFETQTFSNICAYGLDNSNIAYSKISNGDKKYYSIVHNTTIANYLFNKSGIKYEQGELIYPLYKNSSNGTVAIAVDPDGTGIIKTLQISLKDIAPLANSSDMINKSYFGRLTINKDGYGYRVYTKYESLIEVSSDYYLDNISVSSFMKNKKALEIATNGFNSDYTNKSSNIPNMYKLKIGSSMIVTNKININGINYYIGYFESNNINGPICYVVIRDMGNNYMKYRTINQINSENISEPIYESYESNNTFKLSSSASIINNNYNNTSNDLQNKDKNYQTEEPVGVKLITDNNKDDTPFIDNKSSKIPPDYDGWKILNDVEEYNLSAEKPYDTKHLTHINRFHLQTNNGMLSTKSFIFVTRPDLNLYAETVNPETLETTVDTWSMNPDLKRQPGFKYIARLRGTADSPGIGTRIMSSLEYWGIPNDSKWDTPWLSVMTNQARGYSPVDRELDTVEMGETFHGTKIIYAEPTFKHKIAGTVSIPFVERRDLTLYFTLRLWIEYIQAVSMGYCSPRYENKMNGILDYAVSLYYITTDETMENILYWEKLTGLIPLTVPDSFFDWDENSNAREMRYNINFAYSFRTVLDEMHLSEINNLYNRNKTAITGMPLVPKDNFDYVNNFKYNNTIARIASLYGKEKYDNTEKIEDVDNESNLISFVNNPSKLRKYYYGGLANVDGTVSDNHIVRATTSTSAKANFLPNWNIRTQTYGIPYVKGPFIDHDPSAEKYILRWV